MKALSYIASACLLAAAGAAQAGGDLERGRQIAEQQCQACHGVDGNGDNPMYPRLAGQHANYLAHSLSQYKNGERSNAIMAPMAAGLSEADIEAVAAWYGSRSGLTEPRAPRMLER
ncbi:c-type cytochrome [Thiohalobacter thiocyanaticus]|uniref:Cytochrome c n=1 Tax=Thiohalobacter thiocyanaticus TaxID=585455 RepID=A0A426QGD4_9GAMM|nr:cytochrome c [Thiohalobacter thiocyanaticus]RRQ20805.1 cytochrome c [Thiohalobacter thiocyanaticus]